MRRSVISAGDLRLRDVGARCSHPAPAAAGLKEKRDWDISSSESGHPARLLQIWIGP